MNARRRLIQIFLITMIAIVFVMIIKTFVDQMENTYDETDYEGTYTETALTEWHVYYGNTVDTIFAETCEIKETPSEGRSRYNSDTYLYSYRTIRFLTNGNVVAFYNFDSEEMGREVKIETVKSYRQNSF